MIPPPDDIPATVKALGRLTVADLKQRYAEVFGESTRSNHKQHLVKRIVWRMGHYCLRLGHSGRLGRWRGPRAESRVRTGVSDAGSGTVLPKLDVAASIGALEADLASIERQSVDAAAAHASRRKRINEREIELEFHQRRRSLERLFTAEKHRAHRSSHARRG